MTDAAYDGPPIDQYEDAGHGAAADRAPRDLEPAHLPPQDLWAEEATLGAMLREGHATILTALDRGLEGRHFYRPSHRVIYDAIVAQYHDNGAVDTLTIINRLRATKVKDELVGRGKEVIALGYVGGAGAVMTLEERVPAAANAKQYIDDVVEVATKRRMVEIGHEIARYGYDTTVTGDDGVRQAEQELLALVKDTGEKHRRGDVVETDASIDRWAAAYERYHDDEELYERETLSWGSVELDERLGRMRPGQLFVPAGPTKHGKTWFCLDVAEAVMQQGARVLIDSGEMEDEELVERWIAMGGHNYTAVQEKRIPPSVMAERVKVLRRWRRRTTTGRMSIERLRAQVSRAKLEGDPFRMVVVDHLGLVRPAPGAARHGRTEFLEDAVAELKAMAVEYGFTLLMVCQLSRPPQEKDTHPRYLRPPIQSDLKGASGIEQIATAVIFVWRQMDRATGKFVGQKAHLLFPFHRSRPTPKSLPCEFVLPARPGQLSGSAYKFVPVTVDNDEGSTPTPEMVSVQEQLEGTFGPLQVVPNAPANDDDIPF